MSDFVVDVKVRGPLEEWGAAAEWPIERHLTLPPSLPGDDGEPATVACPLCGTESEMIDVESVSREAIDDTGSIVWFKLIGWMVRLTPCGHVLRRRAVGDELRYQYS